MNAESEGYKRLFSRRDLPVPVYDIDLKNASDTELEQLSLESGIGLSLMEMKRVRDHFTDKGRNPTDIELEAKGLLLNLMMHSFPECNPGGQDPRGEVHSMLWRGESI